MERWWRKLMMSDLKSLPSVDELLQSSKGEELVDHYSHGLTVKALREALEEARIGYQDEGKQLPARNEFLVHAEGKLASWTSPTLYPVINATGVIIHTNLGRAPLSEYTLKAIAEVGGGYSTLEFDMERGERGSRLEHASALFEKLLGVEGALVVNNNASAVLLVLQTFAKNREVVIARSQLIEIGGGFRIPEVLQESGASLVEVGTTNRVHIFDYEGAINEHTAAVMRAHHSNFSIVGFTKEPALQEIVDIAHANSLLVIDDLGSGALLDTAPFGLKHEPMVQESLQAGVDLVCFSGDKLLGGPQAGIILGRKDLIDRLKTEPLARAVRADKTALAGLSATLIHYLKGEAEEKVPVWQMIAALPGELRGRTEVWRDEIGRGEIVETRSKVGGGSLPGETLPTYALAFNVAHPQRFLKALRDAPGPVIARVEDDRVIFDPRTVLPRQDADFINTVKNIGESDET
jgi:L-seryl-tRNA(Ser) seleniumtransferase